MRKLFVMFFVLVTALPMSYAKAATHSELEALFIQVRNAPQQLFPSMRTSYGWLDFSIVSDTAEYSFSVNRESDGNLELRIELSPVDSTSIIYKVADYLKDRNTDGVVDDGLDGGIGLEHQFHRDIPTGVVSGADQQDYWTAAYERALTALRAKLATVPTRPIPR